jgi:hypothetical protein
MLAHAHLTAAAAAYPHDAEVATALTAVSRALGQHAAAAHTLLAACQRAAAPVLVPWTSLHVAG